MKKALVIVALALSACAAKDGNSFVQGGIYKSICKNAFDGKYDGRPDGSCSRGPIDLLIDLF